MREASFADYLEKAYLRLRLSFICVVPLCYNFNQVFIHGIFNKSFNAILKKELSNRRHLEKAETKQRVIYFVPIQ